VALSEPMKVPYMEMPCREPYQTTLKALIHTRPVTIIPDQIPELNLINTAMSPLDQFSVLQRVR